MERFFKPKQKSCESGTNVSSEASTGAQKRTRVEFSPDDIIADPGIRQPIEEYDVDIRDQVRRSYLLKGPCQPIGYEFPKKQQGKEMRRFQEAWFQKYNWLEYSVAKDEAYCFYCYLFKQDRSEKGASDIFTRKGFSNWRKALEAFNQHVGTVNSAHNDARQHREDFKNQRQSVSHVLSSHGRQMEIDYRSRLTAILDVVRILLVQGLVFRGHGESSSSKNKENFLEILNWYAKRVEKVGNVINENAPGNNQLTSPLIQKQLVNACTAETTLAIINEIGDSNFSLIVDKSRDKSIKEQMVVILRFVNKQGQVVERFLVIQHVADTSAFSLKVTLDELLARHGLSISKLRGQGYDEPSNMRGEFNGLKTLILKERSFSATASVERSFSAMNIIKTDLHNKIGDEWLNDMMICYIKRQVFETIDDEAILVRFQNMQSRRIQLPLH
ncbi:uncharacterized protein LOC120250388 [Dioscorea cayenensis subsp. rotundata]|uniref:Uncharacterized protein LOC120250388 n=1 Tax=Dioscorea cayennensis subsp. rotundata TaxID=55577 RepID=A0AB40AJQ0_DIOCR|nr:uncharacterized protein LOC120250388 [Dioscorea cayenensis subsp. rotundata]XP_039115135.1 uncharacterized protein LOC120250388 [Dioscorea cayenensis subsp. rotundata]XP_039115136.1 uncharacterized protein LOC120250388 [Dioscorea cayenensis subsp. rotundata]